MAVDEAGDDPVAIDGERARVVGHGIAGSQDRLDPVAGDEDPPVGQPAAVDDVEEVGRVDEDPLGHAVSLAAAMPVPGRGAPGGPATMPP